jgi:enhancing lycopene biosynthesis protein 2
MLRRSCRFLSGAIPSVYEEPHPWIKPDKPAPPPPHYKALICLSGCGVYDGSEITESVATMIALEQQHFHIAYCAPNRQQFHVVDHNKGAPSIGESRHIGAEAARIARGPCIPLEEVNVKDYDCLVFPGGYGVMKNLSNFAVADTAAGEKPMVHTDVAELINAFYRSGKPIGAACIAPVVVAAVLGPEIKATKRPPLKITLGHTEGDAQRLAESFGSVELQECEVGRCHRDLSYNVVSTPAYMCDDASPSTVFEGITRMTKELRAIVAFRKTGVSNAAI